MFFSSYDFEVRYNPSGEGKFKCIWLGPYIVTKVLKMDAYDLIDYEGNKLYTWALSKEVL